MLDVCIYFLLIDHPVGIVSFYVPTLYQWHGNDNGDHHSDLDRLPYVTTFFYYLLAYSITSRRFSANFPACQLHEQSNTKRFRSLQFPSYFGVLAVVPPLLLLWTDLVLIGNAFVPPILTLKLILLIIK